LTVYEEEINAIVINQATRILGVYISSSLEWKSQFKVMKGKRNVPISKFMNLELNPYQATIYYNVYMLKSVFIQSSKLK